MNAETPATPSCTRKALSRDQKVAVQTLRSVGKTYREISEHLGITLRAVQLACNSRPTPQHNKKGRKPTLNQEEGDLVEQCVVANAEGRRMTYKQLADHLFPDQGVPAAAIRYVLNARGYIRKRALQKPALTEQHRKVRLAWALEHVHWTDAQWRQVLWSDETWVSAGLHRCTFITCKPGEELNADCVDLKKQRKQGWMFWACFAGDNAGPHLYWQKDWGTVTSERYCQQVLPLVHGWLTFFPDLVFMHDNAPSHSAKLTAAALHLRGIPVMLWPALSPDLNPIEHLWNIMKDWLQIHYPEPKVTPEQLRAHVIEAWYTVATPEQLDFLMLSMKQRCLDVIANNGGHTKW